MVCWSKVILQLRIMMNWKTLIVRVPLRISRNNAAQQKNPNSITSLKTRGSPRDHNLLLFKWLTRILASRRLNRRLKTYKEITLSTSSTTTQVSRAETHSKCSTTPFKRTTIQISYRKALSSHRSLRKCFPKCIKPTVKTIILLLIINKCDLLIVGTWKRHNTTSAMPEVDKKLVLAWNNPKRVHNIWSRLSITLAVSISTTRISHREKTTETLKRIIWCLTLTTQLIYTEMRWP